MTDTAESFWEGRRLVGRRSRWHARGARWSSRPAGTAGPPELTRRSAVELSTQLQAWMVLEAAASIVGKLPPSGKPITETAPESAPDTPAAIAPETAGPKPRETPPGIKSRNSFRNSCDPPH